jgi:hypothetical protein
MVESLKNDNALEDVKKQTIESKGTKSYVPYISNKNEESKGELPDLDKAYGKE